VTWSSLLQSLTDQIRSLGLPLGADNSSEFLLLCLFDNVASPFSVLLGDLFLFDGRSEFFSECKMGNGDILQDNLVG
jgi:hypothetical protein